MASSYIAWYLFLAGAGAGSFLVGALVDLVVRFKDHPWFNRVSPVTDAGLVVGPVLVALSCVFLLLDLGSPEKALYVVFRPRVTPLSIGAWSIMAFLLCSVASLAAGLFTESRAACVAEFVSHCLATLMALCVLVYAGLYLSLFPTVPFLNTPWVVALFAASSLAVGMAVLIVVGFFRQENEGVLEGLDGLIIIDMVVIIFEIIALVGFFLHALSGGAEISVSLNQILFNSEYSSLFWLGVIALGCLVPFTVDFICLRWPSDKVLALGACCTIAGGLCLRFAILLMAVRYNLVDMSVHPFWM